MKKPNLVGIVLGLIGGLVLSTIGTKLWDIRGYSITPSVKAASKNMGIFKITEYYTPDLKDFAYWSTTGRRIGGKQACRIPNKGFYEAVACQGSGTATIRGKRVLYTHDTIRPTRTRSRYKVSDSLGNTSNGSEAKVGESIATDPNIIPTGSLVYLRFLTDKEEPCKTDVCKKANGWYVANDVGSAIDNKEIDRYSGTGVIGLPSRARVNVLTPDKLTEAMKKYLLTKGRPNSYYQ